MDARLRMTPRTPSGSNTLPLLALSARLALAVALLGLALPISAQAADETTPAPAEPTSGSENAETEKTDAEKSDTEKSDTEKSTEGPRRGALTREAAEQGEAELFKSVRVFQQRYLIKSGRAELLLGGSLSMADPLVQHYGLDASLLYHINEQWSFGAGGTWFRGSTTSTFADIQGLYGLFPEKSTLQAGGFGEVQYSPVFGKFSSFGVAVLQVDAYLLAGGGVVLTTRGDALKPSGFVGLGLRMHTLRWLTLSAEVRDIALLENFQEGSRLMQHWFAGLRLGFWLPPTVQYRYQR